jgi:hypothetical protein
MLVTASGKIEIMKTDIEAVKIASTVIESVKMPFEFVSTTIVTVKMFFEFAPTDIEAVSPIL